MIRRVETELSTAALPPPPRESDARRVYVAIDVLRASTTIVAALANGARAVVPVADPAAAIALAATLPKDSALLGGERGGMRIDGFDLDNSPRAYDAARVAGKTIVFTTTNGTRALLDLGALARTVLVGGLVNAGAIARALLARDSGCAVLVCAGQVGAFCIEDLLGAGAIACKLSAQASHSLEFDDATAAAARLFAACAAELRDAVHAAAHARQLERLGLSADVDFCCLLDAFDIAPALHAGAIT